MIRTPHVGNCFVVGFAVGLIVGRGVGLAVGLAVSALSSAAHAAGRPASPAWHSLDPSMAPSADEIAAAEEEDL